MKALRKEFALSDMCEVFGVSRSGYYDWLNQGLGQRAQANAQLVVQIKELFELHRANYGSPRITEALRQKKQVCNRKRIERLMRQEGLQARTKRRFRVRTTDSNHDHPIAANLLPDLTVHRADQVWTTDVTYVHTGEGWLYVAGVMDLHSRRIIGWAMEDHLHTTLPIAALSMALGKRQPKAGLVHHSDRGVQYASERYRRMLQASGVQASMSRKGNCYDNAAMESFWSTLKRELVYTQSYTTRAEAKRSIFAWIETYYNPKRLHSSLGYKSPVDFENQLN